MTTQEDPQDPQEDPMVGICTMCKGPIHEVRLKVAPHVLTCSALCARERDLWRKRQAAKRARERKKADNAAKAGGSGGPVSTHEPASCVAAVCPLCEAYENGYVVGKSKAHNEVRAQTLDDTHGRGCGCEPLSDRLDSPEGRPGRTGGRAGPAPRSPPAGLCGPGLRSLVRLLVSRRLPLMRRYQGGISFGPEPTAADLAAAFGLSRTGPGNYNGPCPLCSGDDRFHVHEVDGRAVVGCRGCIDGLAKPERSARYGEVMRLYRGDGLRTTRHAPAQAVGPGRPHGAADRIALARKKWAFRRADPHGPGASGAALVGRAPPVAARPAAPSVRPVA